MPLIEQSNFYQIPAGEGENVFSYDHVSLIKLMMDKRKDLLSNIVIQM